MANKGEHSEFLALLRLLHQGKIQVADSKGLPRDAWLNVLSVSHPSNPNVIYSIGDTDITISGLLRDEGSRIRRSEIGALADSLYGEIFTSTGPSFECASAVRAAELLNLGSRKASSSVKTDLVVRIASPSFAGETHELGFSVKSEIAGSPTLLNAGATKFEYRIAEPPGCDSLAVQEGIARKKGSLYPGPKKLLPALHDVGASVEFERVVNEIFDQNLKMIDTAFPRMLAEILKHAYLESETSLVALLNSKKLISEVSGKLGLPLATTSMLIKHKVKDLLRQSALGMKPSKVWSGEVEAHGGWIVVKEDGQIVCFHLLNDDDFREFLLASCSIDTPGMSKHNAGYAYRENPSSPVRVRLSLQIRFG